MAVYIVERSEPPQCVWGKGGCAVGMCVCVMVGTPLPTQNLKSTRCSRFVLHGVTGV